MTSPEPVCHAATITARCGPAFSPSGRFAATLATDDTGRPVLEQWRLLPTGARLLRCHAFPGATARAALLPLDDGRVISSWPSVTGRRLYLHGDAACEGEGTELAGWPGRGFHPLPAPRGTGLLALAVSHDQDGNSVLHGLRAGAGGWRDLRTVPGALVGGHLSGRRVLFTLRTAGGPGVVGFDLARGTLGPAERLTCRPARLLAVGGGQALVAVVEGAGHRLGMVPAGGDGRLRLLPDASPLCRLTAALHPVAVDPSGTQVLHVEVRGVRSGLIRHSWDSGEIQRIAVPEGELTARCAWTAKGAWLPLSTPDEPLVIAGLPPDGAALSAPAPRGGVAHVHRIAAPTCAPRPRAEVLPGAVGPVEAVVHGPDWRSSRHVVLALHGGPGSRWTLRHDPFLRSLAAAGVTVVAPNQRGSAGYGAGHALAVVNAWGGPDRADIAALADHLRHGRAPGAEPPALFGAGYGGCLALLTAATDLGPWSACVAYAPFVSGPRPFADAAPAVRDTVLRLAGLRPAADAIGPPDLERLAPGLRTRVLVLHDGLDEPAPVAHARALARCLSERGRAGGEFGYEELTAGGPGGPGGAGPDQVAARVLRFLADGGSVPARRPEPALGRR
ncbi:alpha/beta hydrolase family protein [Kitasatospora sp. NPDC004745]|uniref:S9 family peptidase n=1 Tax=Kitasatospora sp. NPDC004745 TaxID=3364019 RepID=UPI0036C17B20